MNIVVIGMGEIGTVICNKIRKNMYNCVIGIDIETETKDYGEVLAMHVCFPEHDHKEFISQLERYIKEIKPKMVILHTTISLDTADYLSKLKNLMLYHVPIRGTHGYIEDFLDRRTLYIGPINKSYDIDFVLTYLDRIFKVGFRVVDSIKESALGKLLSVVWYGMEISFVQGVKMLCDERGINFDQAYTKHFEDDYIGDKYYYNRNLKRVVTNNLVNKQVFYPGVIRGKCVIQDVVLLQKDFDKLAKFILETNEEFKNVS